MELPKYHETLLPILKVLANGEEIYKRDLKVKVRDQYYSHLPDELLNKKINSGDNNLFNRIGWAISDLNLGKFIFYPKKGFAKITEKGKEISKLDSFTLQDLKKDPDFIAYKKRKKEEKLSKNTEDVDIENNTPEELIEKGFSLIENQIKSELLEKLKDIDPYYFERVVLILLKKMDYGDFIETSRSKDGGIDGIINEDKLGLEKIYIQSKRYAENNKVREIDIRNFIGAMSGDTQKGVFVTTSSFSDDAIRKANNASHKIILIDGYKLVDLMYQFNVGIQVKTTYNVKEIDSDFFEE